MRLCRFYNSDFVEAFKSLCYQYRSLQKSLLNPTLVVCYSFSMPTFYISNSGSILSQVDEWSLKIMTQIVLPYFQLNFKIMINGHVHGSKINIVNSRPMFLNLIGIINKKEIFISMYFIFLVAWQKALNNCMTPFFILNAESFYFTNLSGEYQFLDRNIVSQVVSLLQGVFTIAAL